MRHVPVWGAAVLALFLHSPVQAQVGRDIRFVTVDQVEVRSGPSDADEFYVTNRLQRGQPVEVVAEMPGGWLAIKPPEGSFSYINTRFLRHIVSDMPTHVVTLDGVKVPVFIGSEVVNRRPTVVGAWLEPGAQVISKGRPVADEDGSWMPIEPPSRERRYVRASAVEKSLDQANQVIRASAMGSPSEMRSSFIPNAEQAQTVSTGQAAESPAQLWQRAELAERNGQISEATRLYALVGAEAARSNPTLSSLALERARYLQSGYQNYGASVGPTITTPIHLGAPAAPGTSRLNASPSSGGSTFVGQTPRLPPTRNGQTTWLTHRGILRRAGRMIEGQATYVLDDPVTLRPILYASPARGVPLEQHLNRIVTLSGYSVYHGDLRNNYMIAVRLVAD